jgi:hypothetical protein
MISQGPWYALAAPSKQAVRTSVVCVGSRPVLLPPLAGPRRHPEHIDRRFPQGETDQHFWVFQSSSRVLEDHWEIPQPGNRLARLIESGFP